MLTDVTLLCPEKLPTDKLFNINPFLAVSRIVAGEGEPPVRLQKGVYLCSHWNFEHEVQEKLKDMMYFMDLDIAGVPSLIGGLNDYGVCDSPEQLLEAFDFEASKEKFVISLVRLDKKDQPPKGGWRWNKWGPYIGKQVSHCEYLYDEPEIETVYTYSIFIVDGKSLI
jgi:hypothetical protein